MRIISLSSKLIYDIPVSKVGENPMPCPECSKDRKHKDHRSFSYNVKDGVGFCHNCNSRFVEYKQKADKVYKLPEWKNRTELTDKALRWFNGRCISAETLNKMHVSSAMEYMPQTEKKESVVCFPFYREGQLVNIKYRDGAKNFKLFGGSELLFYNYDAILNNKELIIVEGEIDCLSMIEAGFENVVSVPNGASAKDLEYLDNCYDNLSDINRFYLAVDNDPAGYRLREELIRRLGAERCNVVSFDDCKDANEYLVKHGGLELRGTIAQSREVPVAGIFSQSDIYDDIYNLYLNGLQPGVKINMPEFDNLITWETGRLAVVTGIPGHGKGELVDFILVRLNILHGWKVAYYSPENFPMELHYSKIAAKISGKAFDSRVMSQNEFDRVFDHVNNNFFFIYPEDDVTIENILEKARYLVRKNGIRVLVIDPYNKLEHKRGIKESETEYISRFLDLVSLFAKQNNCLVVLVAHPRKMERMKDDKNKFEIPTLYDINGSANFFNKTDYGMVMYRNFSEKLILVRISKVKFKHLGETGDISLEYEKSSGRLYPHGFQPDRENYLTKDWQKVEEAAIDFTYEEPPF